MTAPSGPARVLEPLGERDCWAHLESRSIGRIAVARPGLGPLVVPVSFAVGADRTLLFRTAPGTKVDALLVDRASFQVDELDLLHGTGWSVLVEGTAEVRWADPADPRPDWAPADLPFLVELTPVRITGRELRLDLVDTDPRGYR